MILFAGKECVLVNEAEAVAPRVVRVERSFTPRAFDDIAGARAVNVFGRETFQLSRALVNCFQIVYGKVDVVRRRLWFLVENAFAGHVDEGENYRPAIDVMTRTARDAPAAIAEQSSVKLLGTVEIVHLENDPVECRHRLSLRSDLSTD